MHIDTCAQPPLKRQVGVGDSAVGAIEHGGLVWSPFAHAWAGTLGPWWPLQSPLSVRRQAGPSPPAPSCQGLGSRPLEDQAGCQAGVPWGLRLRWRLRCHFLVRNVGALKCPFLPHPAPQTLSSIVPDPSLSCGGAQLHAHSWSTASSVGRGRATSLPARLVLCDGPASLTGPPGQSPAVPHSTL